MKKYFVNYNNYNFVFSGCGYGHIKDKKIFFYSTNGGVEFNIDQIKFVQNKMKTSNKHVCVFSGLRFNGHYAEGEPKNKHLGIFIHAGYPDLPDIILPSEYCVRFLIKLIKRYNEEMVNK